MMPSPKDWKSCSPENGRNLVVVDPNYRHGRQTKRAATPCGSFTFSKADGGGSLSTRPERFARPACPRMAVSLSPGGWLDRQGGAPPAVVNRTGPPDNPGMEKPDVLVIGAGIVGCSLAR